MGLRGSKEHVYLIALVEVDRSGSKELTRVSRIRGNGSEH